MPLSLNLYDKKTAEMISNLFKKLVQVYRPFWGCISNKALSRRYGKYLEGNLPTIVHWMNYWSEDIANAIGIEKIRKIVQENPEISFENGNILVKNTAFDINKDADIRLHEDLQKQFFM